VILRPYQVRAVDAAERELQVKRRALLVMATGGGKTIVFAALAERWRARGRVLVLAHREELLTQAADKIAASTLLSTGIEQAGNRVRGALPDVVIASVQTLAQPQRRASFAPDAFDLVVVDEAHHATASTYRAVLDYFGAAARLGVTATPDRADGVRLDAVLGRTVFRYPIRQAVREGYLVDLRRRAVVLDGLDLSRVSQRAGDYDAAELEAEMVRAPAVEAVARTVFAHASGRPTVLFCAGIAHSRAVAAALNALRPGIAAAASGDDREGVAMLQRGEVDILCNADLTTEGFDFPPLSCVGLVRPTKSLGRATQQVGRVTRLYPGKRDGLVIEFIGSRGGQVSTVDVVGADLSERVRVNAERLLDAQPAMSVLDALDRSLVASGISARPAQRERPVLDPLRLILSLEGMVLEERRPNAQPATAVQVQLLHAAGIEVAGCDVRQASILLEGIRWRRQRGRSSPAEALQLIRYGFPPDCRADEAHRRLAQMRLAAA
jgi:superfamily II DNA or RNA helicase